MDYHARKTVARARPRAHAEGGSLQRGRPLSLRGCPSSSCGRQLSLREVVRHLRAVICRLRVVLRHLREAVESALPIAPPPCNTTQACIFIVAFLIVYRFCSL